jgi:mannose-6-phosphate isomerase-like protein (cupin superfamily)
MKVIRSEELVSTDGFFSVLHNTGHTQVALMTLGEAEVSGEYGTDHPDSDQVLIVLEGGGRVRCEGELQDLRPGDIVVIPAGAQHQISGPNRTLSVYGPPAYPEET